MRSSVDYNGINLEDEGTEYYLQEKRDTAIELVSYEEWVLYFWDKYQNEVVSLSLPIELHNVPSKQFVLISFEECEDSSVSSQSAPQLHYAIQYYDQLSETQKTYPLPSSISQQLNLAHYNGPFTITTEKIENHTTATIEELAVPQSRISLLDKYIKVISFLFLNVAMLAIASGGVAFKMLPPDVIGRPLLACLWRNQATTLVLFFPAVWQFYKMKDRSALKSFKIWVMICGAGLAAAGWTGTFAVALGYTSLTKVYLLNNCQPLLIVIWNKITGKPVNLFHFGGVILGVSGLLLTCYSGNSSTEENVSFSMREIIGDVIAFLGAVFAAFYISLGGQVRGSVPSFLFIFPATMVSLIIYAPLTIAFEDTPVSLLFVWYRQEYLPVISWLALVTGLLGISVLAIIMKHLPPLLIAVVLLAEPIFASILAIIFGVEEVPSWLTWVGALLITFGVLLVTLGFGGYRHVIHLVLKIPCIRNRVRSSNFIKMTDLSSNQECAIQH